MIDHQIKWHPQEKPSYRNKKGEFIPNFSKHKITNSLKKIARLLNYTPFLEYGDFEVTNCYFILGAILPWKWPIHYFEISMYRVGIA